MKRKYYSLYGPYIMKFIALKNNLGYKYTDAGCALALLDKLAVEQDITDVPITKDLVDIYIKGRPNQSEKTKYNSIQILRQFALFLCNLGLESYIPRLPKCNGSFIPYIFSQDEIKAVFAVCDGLSPSQNRKSGVFLMPFLISGSGRFSGGQAYRMEEEGKVPDFMISVIPSASIPLL